MKNRINPAKLALSKWTAVTPRDREKHFIVTDCIRDENDTVSHCIIEAVHSHRTRTIDWRELQDREQWLQGWL